jgi:DNA-3-methyladenine glycosylase I
MIDNINTCAWHANDPLMKEYHDNEWGVPLYDDRKLFEFLVLDAFQAGLSWRTILYKRENFRAAFDNFDPEKIKNYDSDKIQELMNDSGIVRNRLKIISTIDNAKAYFKAIDKYGSFAKLLWSFTEYNTIHTEAREMKDIPVKTEISDSMSKTLKKEGFRFVGSTICYSMMQAAGIVNDHIVTCERYDKIVELSKNNPFR